jgi:hypothetical protein
MCDTTQRLAELEGDLESLRRQINQLCEARQKAMNRGDFAHRSEIDEHLFVLMARQVGLAAEYRHLEGARWTTAGIDLRELEDEVADDGRYEIEAPW